MNWQKKNNDAWDYISQKQIWRTIKRTDGYGIRILCRGKVCHGYVMQGFVGQYKVRNWKFGQVLMYENVLQYKFYDNGDDMNGWK